MRVVMLGAPGAGKGTQAVRLAKWLDAEHVSTGDMLREARASGSPLGSEAERYMSAGALVPDQVVIGIVAERLGALGSQHVILDGFPRTEAQARGLDELGYGVHVAVAIEVDDEEVVERLSGRLTCTGCGAPYHRTMKRPRQEGVCDLCGAALHVRNDDQESVIRARLASYHEHTAPLLDFYGSKGVLRRVEGRGEMDAIYERIAKVLEPELERW